ncbi:MAG: peptide deformylase [Rhodobacteraceae bacterium]|nr:peptide deformylase [Paracoccaceae bacterium]
MILSILRWPDPVLTAPCAPATLSDDLARLAADMLDTMYAAPGRGLAAPQVGRLLRLFVMDAGWPDGRPDPRVLVNPRILWRGPLRATGPEGCLSIPGPTVLVERATELRLGWTTLDGRAEQETFTGFAAICAQHEYDHLDGILTLDRLSPEARAAALAQVTA